MKEQVLAEMDALGCAPSLRRLIQAIPDDQSVVVRPHPARAAAPETLPALQAAVQRALQRDLLAPRRSDGRAEDVCLETWLALPATGWCDHCEQVCA